MWLGSVERKGKWPPLALSHLSLKYAETFRVTLTSSSLSFTGKQNNSQRFWNLLLPFLLEGDHDQGLKWEQMLCHLLHFSLPPLYNSPTSQTASFLFILQTEASIYIPTVGWNRGGQLGRWGLGILWIWVRATPVTHEWFLEQYLAYGVFSINGRCYYHINRKSHFLSFRCYKFFEVQFRGHKKPGCNLSLRISFLGLQLQSIKHWVA